MDVFGKIIFVHLLNKDVCQTEVGEQNGEASLFLIISHNNKSSNASLEWGILIIAQSLK